MRRQKHREHVLRLNLQNGAINYKILYKNIYILWRLKVLTSLQEICRKILITGQEKLMEILKNYSVYFKMWAVLLIIILIRQIVQFGKKLLPSRLTVCLRVILTLSFLPLVKVIFSYRMATSYLLFQTVHLIIIQNLQVWWRLRTAMLYCSLIQAGILI